MDGTTYKRKNGTWAYQIDRGRTPEGKRIRPTKGGFRTKREADAARVRALETLQNADSDVHVEPPAVTLGKWIADWMERHARPNLSVTTVKGYRDSLKYLSAEVLATPIRQLTTLQLESEYNRIRSSGGKVRKTGEPKPVSAKTLRNTAAVVRTALEDAVRLDVLGKNPAAYCQLPSLEQKEKRILEADQLLSFLEAANRTRFGALVAVAAGTGCRRGELLALTHEDLDLFNRSMTISKALVQADGELYVKCPKNRKIRVVFLPQSTCDRLAAHLRDQEEMRVQFGRSYSENPRLVFCEPDGTYTKPDTVTAEISRLARKCGLKRISLHSLRHTHGSQLLSNGVSLPAVSRRLGHSSPAVTARVYSHALSADEEGAAEVWDSIVSVKKEGQEGPATAGKDGVAANGSEKAAHAPTVN